MCSGSSLKTLAALSLLLALAGAWEERFASIPEPACLTWGRRCQPNAGMMYNNGFNPNYNLVMNSLGYPTGRRWGQQCCWPNTCLVTNNGITFTCRN